MKRNILFIAIIGIMLFSLGTAFASENTSDTITTDSNILSYDGNSVINENNSISTTVGENVQSNSSSSTTLEENALKNNSNDDGYNKIFVSDKVREININSSAEFKKVINNITNFAAGSQNIILNLTSSSYDLEDDDKDIVFNFNTGNLIIKGNNAQITASKGNVLFRIGTGASIYITQCYFTKAKPVIRNYGTCYVVECNFDNNQRANTVNSHESYRKGGAIDNYGTLTCIECNFTNNKASYGGAVCGEENSESTFINCQWGLNSAGGSSYGEDIYVHNSASAHIYYNSTSQKIPSYGMQPTGVIQIIDTTNNDITNDKVYNADNVGDILTAFAYMSSGVYSATNITINLKNTEYTFNQNSVLEDWGKRIWDFSYSVWFEYPWETIKSIWNMAKNVVVESVNDDIKDSENDQYLCWVKPGLTLTINGNGATLKCDDYNYRLFYIVSSASVILNNVTITGFASSILNNGVLTCNYVTFKDNKIDYIWDNNDIGGAVRNYGVANFINCDFTNNYANKGGAIYNEMGTIYLDNCTFKENWGKFDYKQAAEEKQIAESEGTFEYMVNTALSWLFQIGKSTATLVSRIANPKIENDIYSKGGLIKINTNLENPVGKILGKKYALIYAKDRNLSNTNYINNITEINKFLGYSSGNGVYNLLLKDKSAVDKTIATTQLNGIINNFPDYATNEWLNNTVNELKNTINSHNTYVFYENDMITVKTGMTLIFDGSNEIIKSYAGESGETHFITNYGTTFLKNMVLDGFNKAIINYGQLICENVTFKNCRVNYATDEDYGGAVSNIGNALFINCTFADNYAKYGAAVYNTGSAEYINCTATNNIAYSGGAGFIDDNEGCSKFNNCTLNNSSYILNDGASIAKNSALTYIKNALIAAVFVGSMIAGFNAGAITAALGQLGTYTIVSLIAGAGLIADTAITAYLNTINHNYVFPGKYIVTTFEKAVVYLGTAVAGYSLGVAAKNIYNKINPEKAPTNTRQAELEKQIDELNKEYDAKAEIDDPNYDFKGVEEKIDALEDELWDLMYNADISENASFNVQNISRDYD